MNIEKGMYILDSKERKCILDEVSPEALLKYRLSKKPGLLIKQKSSLYLAKTIRNHTISTKAFGSSLCETCDCISHWCPKSTGLTLPIQLGFGFNFNDAVQRYGRPEKYNFITFAAEFFNRKTSECIVLECQNYRKRNPDDYEEQYFAETI